MITSFSFNSNSRANVFNNEIGEESSLKPYV